MLSNSRSNSFRPLPVNPASVPVMPAVSDTGLGVDTPPPLVLQISEFRKDFPRLAARLESMRRRS